MTWGNIGGAAVSVIGGALLSRGSSGASSSPGAAAADPFASQRPQYQQLLQQLMTDPNAFTQSAQSQAVTKQGMNAIDANMAAKGLTNSGAQEQALTEYATQQAGQGYQQQMANLMTLSGATTSNPGQAGQILNSQQSAQTAALGTLGSAAGKAIGDNFTTTVPDNTATPQIDMTGFMTPSAPITLPWQGSPQLGSGFAFNW